jgi:hypothetical protein
MTTFVCSRSYKAMKQQLVNYPSVYVFTDAGKPVFVRSSSDDELTDSRICSFLSSLRSSIVHGRLGLGDIKSMRTGSLRLSFMKVKSLVLVAVLNVDQDESTETVVYLRLVLEYVYANLLITLTDQALAMVDQNPSYDLQRLLGSENLSFGLFNPDDPLVCTGSFLTGGVEPFFPLPPRVREAATLVLRDVNNNGTNSFVFAMILSDKKLVSLVQPPHRQHCIQNFDLHLFVSFIFRQPNLLSDDLWLPFCFPRFDASGYLYCYINCLDVETKTVLVLVTQDPSHFTTARKQVANRIRPKLGLPAYNNESVLEILDGQQDISQGAQVRSADVKWRRSTFDDEGDDEDYELVPHQHNEHAMALILEIKGANTCFKADMLLNDFMHAAGINHFVFRLDITTATKEDGRLIQYITGSPLPHRALPERQLWSTYRKLSLRLRRGSVATESILDAFDTLIQGKTDSQLPKAPELQNSLAMGLLEAPPKTQGVCYIMNGALTFLAMNGQGKEDFEL